MKIRIFRCDELYLRNRLNCNKNYRKNGQNSYKDSSTVDSSSLLSEVTPSSDYHSDLVENNYHSGRKYTEKSSSENNNDRRNRNYIDEGKQHSNNRKRYPEYRSSLSKRSRRDSVSPTRKRTTSKQRHSLERGRIYENNSSTDSQRRKYDRRISPYERRHSQHRDSEDDKHLNRHRYNSSASYGDNNRRGSSKHNHKSSDPHKARRGEKRNNDGKLSSSSRDERTSSPAVKRSKSKTEKSVDLERNER